MKIFAIIIVVVLLLAGGAFGVMKVMEIGPFASAETGTDVALIEKEATFISLDPLTVNVFSGNKIIATLRVAVIIRAQGNKNADFVYARIPKISDVLFRDMHAFLPRIINPEDKSIDVYLLKKRLKLAVDKVYPKGEIEDVLIQAIEVLER